MFVIVTVHAEQFPVTAVWWIVIVIMIPVMNGEQTKILAGKFSSTPSTDPRINSERPLPVGLQPTLSFTPSFGYRLIGSVFA